MKGLSFKIVLVAAAIYVCGFLPTDAAASPSQQSVLVNLPAPAPSATPPDPEQPADPGRPNIRKRNERSADESSAESSAMPATHATAGSITYLYEFNNPNYAIGRIKIRHDENGNGTVSFLKRGEQDMLSESIRLTETSLEKLKSAYSALDFLNSNEDYQARRDYSHLGTVSISVRSGDRHRETRFNWTDNKDAKSLADEYRRIANQFVWVFDMNLARENQPLEAPKLMSALEALLRRNEISDPRQLSEFLRDVNVDERLPLIARNHALKLLDQIRRSKK